MLQSKVLCFNLTVEHFRLLAQCAQNVFAEAVEVPQAEFSQTVGALLGVLPRENTVCLSPFAQPMIIMCSFEQNKMEAFLKALRAQEIYIPYKAMLTPVNLNWRCEALIKELIKEHEQLRSIRQKNEQ